MPDQHGSAPKATKAAPDSAASDKTSSAPVPDAAAAPQVRQTESNTAETFGEPTAGPIAHTDAAPLPAAPQAAESAAQDAQSSVATAEQQPKASAAKKFDPLGSGGKRRAGRQPAASAATVKHNEADAAQFVHAAGQVARDGDASASGSGARESAQPMGADAPPGGDLFGDLANDLAQLLQGLSDGVPH